MGVVGLEPTTHWLKPVTLPTELHTMKIKNFTPRIKCKIFIIIRYHFMPIAMFI